MMKLYGYYRSSASYRIRIVLNAKGLDWEYVTVRLDKGEQREPGHIARNPMQLVPVLEIGDVKLSQSLAIADYLETRHPQPSLMPADPVKRAQVQEMQHIISSEIQPLGNQRVLQYLSAKLNVTDDEVKKWSQTWMARGFAAFEIRAAERSADGRFSFGDQLTFADVWLIPQLYNAVRFELDLDPYPTISSIAAHCATIEAVAAAHPAKQPDAPQ